MSQWNSTSIKIDPETWKKVRIWAIQNNKKIQDVVNDVLRSFVEERPT